MTNRLISEKSPYLLQHAENPVQWYPWSEEAFEKAAHEDKPVFLSVGYATCHWCHVMAHESFEDKEVAALMNERFINIKVDREERPDIDHTYMTVCQMLTGQGGWPLTIIMTPDKQPFYAATYIPKETRFNRPGMKEIIPRIGNAWEQERDQILRSAKKITGGFSQTLKIPPGESPGNEQISKARKDLDDQFDPEHGGFGHQPKFPSPHNLLFLMRYSQSFGDQGAFRMVKRTLDKMNLGGIYDQIGGGFHRYSTDSRWKLPHFEKMLYDQALLILAYSEAWRMTGTERYRQIVFDTAEYVAERLTSADGGFFSAEDADSEGEEGAFYLWSLEEVQSMLKPADSALFADLYHIEPDGNFLEESSGSKTGTNVLWLEKDMRQLAEERGMSERDLVERLRSIRSRLKQARDRRVRPALDDKILTDWNGLMIASFARAGSVFNHQPFISSAEAAWEFVQRELIDEQGDLLHRYRQGEARIPAMADDYAFLIWGLIELNQSTLDVSYLEQALRLNEQFLDLFEDQHQGGVYFSGKSNEKLLGRQKQIYDGAIPSSNSVTAMNLLRLARLTGRTDLEERADQLFRSFALFFDQSPSGATHAIEALMYATQSSAEIVICAEESDLFVQELTQTIKKQMKRPYVLLLKTADNEDSLSKTSPYTTDFPVADEPAVYVCRQFRCEAPVHTVEELEQLLRD